MGIFSEYFYQESFFGIFDQRVNLKPSLKSLLPVHKISPFEYSCNPDQNFEILYISNYINELGYNPGDFYQKPSSYLNLIDTRDQVKYRDAIQEMVRQKNSSLHLTYNLLAGDGRIRVEDKIWLRESKAGNVIQGEVHFGTSFNESLFFSHLFEMTPFCLAVIDQEHRVLKTNRSFLDFFKLDHLDFGTLKIDDLLHEFLPEPKKYYQTMASASIKNGKKKAVLITVNCLELVPGSVYSLIRVTEADQNKSDTQRLHENNLKFNLAQKVARIGIWELDIREQVIRGSSEAAELAGIENWKASIALDQFIQTVAQNQQTEIRNKISLLLENQEEFDGIYQVIRPLDGKPAILQIKAFYNMGFSKEIILGTIQDITQLKETENELKIRNLELNNFVYKVSHDVRAPLVSIEGLINLMKLAPDHSQNEHYLGLIAGSIKKLDLFIRNVLSHSKNLNTELNISCINLGELIEKVIADLYYLEGIENVKWQVQVGEGQFYSDSDRLEVIFKNLISNSVQYQYPGRQAPVVQVVIHIQKDYLQMEFADNGEGIDQKIIPRIFEMFYRGNEKSKGSGIGLYIVKQNLEKISGEISVASELYKGTTFRLRLKNFDPSRSL